MSIPKLSKEMLKYVSDKQPYSVQSIRYMAVNDVYFCVIIYSQSNSFFQIHNTVTAPTKQKTKLVR